LREGYRSALKSAAVPRKLPLLDALRDLSTDKLIRVWIGIVALFALLGSLERVHGVPLGLFDLDGEGKPPAAFSALLLVGAGVTAYAIGRLPAERDRRVLWTLMGLFFVYMAADEALTVHEHLQDLVGIGWTKLYAPLVLVAGIGWLQIVRRIWPLGERVLEWGPRLFALAPAPWLVAVALERLEANPDEGRVSGYAVMATIEEVFEMIGDGLFFIGLLFAFQSLARYVSSTRATA
jgi:hypothetical protein